MGFRHYYVHRGGAWGSPAEHQRAGRRRGNRPELANGDVGLRIAFRSRAWDS